MGQLSRDTIDYEYKKHRYTETWKLYNVWFHASHSPLGLSRQLTAQRPLSHHSSTREKKDVEIIESKRGRGRDA